MQIESVAQISTIWLIIEDRSAKIQKLVDEKIFCDKSGKAIWKTTTMNLLVKYLSLKYLTFFISFEGLGESAFEKESAFCSMICKLLYDTIHYEEVPALEER